MEAGISTSLTTAFQATFNTPIPAIPKGDSKGFHRYHFSGATAARSMPGHHRHRRPGPGPDRQAEIAARNKARAEESQRVGAFYDAQEREREARNAREAAKDSVSLILVLQLGQVRVGSVIDASNQ
jgi:hypothetical protein